MTVTSPQVREVMQQATSSLWQDASWRGVLLEAPEVWGIQELSGESVVMRVTARTAPLRQWDVARELRERLKNSLAGRHGGGEPGACRAGQRMTGQRRPAVTAPPARPRAELLPTCPARESSHRGPRPRSAHVLWNPSWMRRPKSASMRQ